VLHRLFLKSQNKNYLAIKNHTLLYASNDKAFEGALQKGMKMGVKVKVARTAKELSDVYRLRYQIYHVEEGFYQDNKSGFVTDVYDSIPNTVNVIAYNDLGEPIGTIRAVEDSEIGTPSDSSFDFTPYREKIRKEAKENGADEPQFVSAGMLAIAPEWRNRRDVFRSLLRMAVDVGKSMQKTHIISTVNHETISIYKRLGWDLLAEPILIEEIGTSIVPVAISLDVIYQWAFDSLIKQRKLLEHFSGCFQWYLMDGNTVLFEQDDKGDDAYLVTKGMVDITCYYKESDKRIPLAHLVVGDMFGEMSLIDEAPRSASAITRGNTELLVINREAFWQKIDENPAYLRDLMSVLSSRLRSADERAILYAHAPVQERLNYFIRALEQYALPDPRNPERKISKTGVEELAEMSLTSPQEALSFLQTLEKENKIELNKGKLIFLGTEFSS